MHQERKDSSQNADEYKHVWKTLGIIFTVFIAIGIGVMVFTSCKGLDLGKNDIDEEFTIGVQKHHAIKKQK